jgi:hypothetical protein
MENHFGSNKGHRTVTKTVLLLRCSQNWAGKYDEKSMQQAVGHIYLLRYVIRVNVELHNLHST